MSELNRTPLGNGLYCALEVAIMEHGETVQCTPECAVYYPCTAMCGTGPTLVDLAEDMTPAQATQFLKVLEFFFANMASAGYPVKESEKNPYAVRLGRRGAKALANRATHADLVRWGRMGAEARWGKRWVWK